MDNGYEYKHINAAGSAVLRARPSVLHTINVHVATGTVILYDNASGTSTAIMGTFGGGAAVANSFVFDAQLKQGLYYLATGTPSMTVTVS